MAVAGQSTGNHDPISATLQGVQDHDHIQTACTWQQDDLNRWGVLHAEPTRQVGSIVGAMFTGISNDL
mgnify:FL=1